jgi:hypothetical protein
LCQDIDIRKFVSLYFSRVEGTRWREVKRWGNGEPVRAEIGVSSVFRSGGEDEPAESDQPTVSAATYDDRSKDPRAPGSPRSLATRSPQLVTRPTARPERTHRTQPRLGMGSGRPPNEPSFRRRGPSPERTQRPPGRLPKRTRARGASVTKRTRCQTLRARGCARNEAIGRRHRPGLPETNPTRWADRTTRWSDGPGRPSPERTQSTTETPTAETNPSVHNPLRTSDLVCRRTRQRGASRTNRTADWFRGPLPRTKPNDRVTEI